MIKSVTGEKVTFDQKWCTNGTNVDLAFGYAEHICNSTLCYMCTQQLNHKTAIISE